MNPKPMQHFPIPPLGEGGRRAPLAPAHPQQRDHGHPASQKQKGLLMGALTKLTYVSGIKYNIDTLLFVKSME